MRSFFTDNVNSILGAISIHLLVVIAFLGFKLGNMEELQKEQILIEFNEEIITPEEEKNEQEDMTSEDAEELMGGLDRRELHSIASNAASKLEKEISTSDYERQVMEELGISSLEAPGATMEKQASQETTDENAIEQKKTVEEKRDFNVPNVIRKENTTVSYFLEGRWHSYIYIPTYKCQGGGTVYLDIVISQSGKVVSAMIQENKSTADPCLREEAYRSATSAQFNADNKASTKQLGTITYVFLAQ